MDSSDSFDVCIIGAGPGGLAVLSACVEPYSLDLLGDKEQWRAAHALSLQQKNGVGGIRTPRVCVVDPEPWLSTWRQRFRNVGIEFLRSPTMAHCDAFDAKAMLAFAGRSGRTNELFDSGCVDKKLMLLAEASDGSWHLPSNQLFMDFCDDLVSRSPHEFVRGTANCIQSMHGEFIVGLDDGRELRSAAVVLALGVPGPPVIPASVAHLPSHLMFHSDDQSGKRLKELGKRGAQRILVLGGGLTAVQVALKGVRKNCEVVLCSRRPLTSRHFDIDKGWFDRREAARHRFDFLSLPMEERLAMIKQTRGGGSIPPFYMSQLRAAEASGRLKVKVSEVRVSEVLDNGVDIELDGSIERFDLVVSACGHRPDCTQLPLIQSLLKDSPTQITGGLPHLSQELQWGERERLFAVGALASLQVGPDAGNIMGIRRAAQIMTSAMGYRDWLHDYGTEVSQIDKTALQKNIRGNPFTLLQNDNEGSETETESEKEPLNDDLNNEQTETANNESRSQKPRQARKRRMGKRRGTHKTHR
eukprot:TRINITY_DN23758_c0_g1_i1.p1 TRINITY_DN23758_c0_g1~~TRINITY_DN23758_c0_g1_i1.p1  ORF type:complete len:529 (+),score=78.61 TRINITY_DN23758_c0_g1_i1:54-1640(+)